MVREGCSAVFYPLLMRALRCSSGIAVPLLPLRFSGRQMVLMKTNSAKSMTMSMSSSLSWKGGYQMGPLRGLRSMTMMAEVSSIDQDDGSSGSGIDADETNVRIARALKIPDEKWARNLMKQMKKPNVETYMLFLNYYMETNQTRLFKNMIDKMRRQGIAFDLTLYNMVIENLLHTMNSEGAMKTLGEMKEKGVDPTSSTYGIFVTFFSLTKDFPKLIEIYEKIKLLPTAERALAFESYFSYFVLAAIDSRNFEFADEIWVELEENKHAQANVSKELAEKFRVFHIKGLKNGEDYVEFVKTLKMMRLHLKRNDIQPAVKLKNELTNRFGARKVVYIPLFQLYPRSSKSTVNLIYEMHAFNIILKPDDYSLAVYNSMMMGHYEEGLKIKEEMVRIGVKPSAQLYHMIIKKLIDASHLSEARVQYAMMRKEDVIPDNKTVTLGVRHLFQIDVPVKETSSLKEMPDVKLVMRIVEDVETLEDIELEDSDYVRVMRILTAVGETERAMKILHSIPTSSELLTNPDLYLVLVKVVVNYGRTKMAKEIIEFMLTKGVRPTIKMFNCLIAFHAARANDGAILSVYKAMNKHHVKPNEETYRILIKAAASNNNLSRALELKAECTEKGFSLDEECYARILRSALQNNRADSDAPDSITAQIVSDAKESGFKINIYDAKWWND